MPITPKSPRSSRALRQLDELSQAEYGVPFAQALEGQPEDIAILRLARLSGIPLKAPFAIPLPADRPSRTKALRYWGLNPAIAGEIGNPNGPQPYLERLREKQAPAYRIVEEIAKVRFRSPRVSVRKVADTINSAHHESNWFTELVKTIQRHVCKSKDKSLLLESVQKAADKLATQSVEAGITVVVAPVVNAFTASIPWLSFVPKAAIVGATFFIVKYAGRTFCSIQIAPQFTLLLSGNNYESR